MDPIDDIDMEAELALRRARLRVLADRVLEAMEALPLPETHLEAAQAQRAIEITDRLMIKLYREPTKPSTHQNHQSNPRVKRVPSPPMRAPMPRPPLKVITPLKPAPQPIQPPAQDMHDPTDYQAMTRNLFEKWAAEGTLNLTEGLCEHTPKDGDDAINTGADESITPDRANRITGPP